jgi:hypothetical protein
LRALQFHQTRPRTRHQQLENPVEHYTKAGMVQLFNWSTLPRSVISADSHWSLSATSTVTSTTVSPGMPPHKAPAT